LRSALAGNDIATKVATVSALIIKVRLVFMIVPFKATELPQLSMD
jgi:hypothetical protein